MKPAALARGMEMTSEETSEEIDADAPKRNSIKVDGIPLTVVTATLFGAHQIRSPMLEDVRSSMPEGIVYLGLGMSKVSAKDPAGRNVELLTCIVTSVEEPAAARALNEVQRELSDKLPREAVASASRSRVGDGITGDHIHWTWGDIDSDTGRVSVGYGGRAGPGFMGGGTLSVRRLKRAPE